MSNTIQQKLTNKTNAALYKVAVGTVIELDFEDYVTGVVTAEIGNVPLDACKAQAVAARTFAYGHYTKQKPISDSSSTAQACNLTRLSVSATSYPNAVQAVKETRGEVLTYKGSVISTCSYCHANGGRTYSSAEVWGGERAWLVAKSDPWDKSAKSGHGVGMSQMGAVNAAKQGVDYRSILAFYYEGTTIKKEETEMASVRASMQIQRFQYAYDNKWGYIPNAAGEVWTQAKQNASTADMVKRYGQKWVGRQVADCSGLFTWAYRQLGSYMYHGSNTMYRKYSKVRGKIGTINQVPGMPVYKHRDDGKEPSQYKGDGIGNMYHVGLYIGNNKVIEARGTSSGVVMSNLSEWTHASDLTSTIYDVGTQTQIPVEDVKAPAETTLAPDIGIATVGSLNLRKAPRKDAYRIAYINKGDQVKILKENCGTAGWYFVKYKSYEGYVMASYIQKG